MIRAHEVGVRFNHHPILEDVDFSLAPGEFLTIIGPNGAGKSTLLKVLDGLIHPTFGAVEIDGRALAEIDRRTLAKIVSFVPQGDPGGFGFTVRAFIEMGRYAHLRPWTPLASADHEAVEEAMETTEVGHLCDRLLGSLSGGERQRALIAAALAQGGRLLLLDEPTSFLDYRHQVQVVDLLSRLHREQGFTIVAVTHDVNATAPVSDNVLALKNGRTAFVGSPEDLMHPGALQDIFDCRFRTVENGDHRWLLPEGENGK